MAEAPPPFGPDAPARHLFAVPPGADYAAALVAGLEARLAGAPPEAMAGVSVIVNSARARSAIEVAFAARAPGRACYLPRVTTLEDLALAPPAALVTRPLPPVPEAVAPVTRLMALTRLVEAYCRQTGMAPGAAPGLARSLADLMDLMDEEGCDLHRLAEAGAADLPAPEGMAHHWQRALDFLAIARDAWPAMRAGLGAAGDGTDAAPPADPRAAEREAISALVAAWEERPPEGPVIVAGSTGSRAIAARVMAAVARLPRGAVVFPGFDPATLAPVWQAVLDGAGDHPGGPFRRILGRLGAEPSMVRDWVDPAAPAVAGAPAARRRLIAEALRPAPVTDAWIGARDAIAAEADAATDDLALIEAPDQRIEAGAIALAVRAALETPGRRVAIVTPDATLARRITAALARLGILPDDSLGRPLSGAPAAVFLRLVLEVAIAGAEGRVEPVTLAGLLGHPLARLGRPRGRHRRLARDFERRALRRRGNLQPATGGVLPTWPGARAEEADWCAAIEAAFAPLLAALADGAPLGPVLDALRAAAEALAAAEPAGEGAEDATPPPPWTGPDGQAARGVLDALAEAAPAYGAAMAPAMLAGVLETLLSAGALPPEATRPHPRVALRGTIEARHETADLTILAGLVEGRWPGTADPGPWLNRPLRRALDLPAPEREIGLAAHDFLQGACRGAVILSRSAAIEGTPMVASRWLTRLETLLAGTRPEALAAMRARGAVWRDLVPALDAPGEAERRDPHLARAPRPMPCPPVALRPRRLGVTRLETLLRDPYAVYAESVLGLRELERLGAPLDARDLGEMLHRVMERHVREGADALDPAEGAAAMMAALDAEMTAGGVPADTARLWRGRLGRAAEALAALQRALRGAGETIGLELSGEIAIPAPNGAVTLVVRADRVDRAPDGTSRVYDYKSGQIPSQKQIGRFAHQLHLAALIADEGGFVARDGAPPPPAMPPGGGAYVSLARAETREPGEPLGAVLDDYRAALGALIARFDADETPYVSRRAVERRDHKGPYDHLARVAEWSGDGAPDRAPADAPAAAAGRARAEGEGDAEA